MQKLFARAGESPAVYIRQRRMRAGVQLLCRGEPVGRAAHLAGFPDPGTFARAFKREYGMPPSSLRPGTAQS